MVFVRVDLVAREGELRRCLMLMLVVVVVVVVDVVDVVVGCWLLVIVVGCCCCSNRPNPAPIPIPAIPSIPKIQYLLRKSVDSSEQLVVTMQSTQAGLSFLNRLDATAQQLKVHMILE